MALFSIKKHAFARFSDFSCDLSIMYSTLFMKMIFKVIKEIFIFLIYLNLKTSIEIHFINTCDHWGPDASLDTPYITLSRKRVWGIGKNKTIEGGKVRQNLTCRCSLPDVIVESSNTVLKI